MRYTVTYLCISSKQDSGKTLYNSSTLLEIVTNALSTGRWSSLASYLILEHRGMTGICHSVTYHNIAADVERWGSQRQGSCLTALGRLPTHVRHLVSRCHIFMFDNRRQLTAWAGQATQVWLSHGRDSGRLGLWWRSSGFRHSHFLSLFCALDKVLRMQRHRDTKSWTTACMQWSWCKDKGLKT